MAEYRLEELARISGVSARNIRAYRERGLLDAPRRVGRSAFYDDYHLSQLRTINQLLRRGFNSAHIAEFFASMRQGADLADILGIQRALLGPSSGGDSEESTGTSRQSTTAQEPSGPRFLEIDPRSDAVDKLIDYGLAEMRDGRVIVFDPTVAEILGRAEDQQMYVRALLRIHDSSEEAVDGLVIGFVEALGESVETKFGRDARPEDAEIDEMARISRDYRELWGSVLAHRLEKALQRHLSTMVSDFPTGKLLSELLQVRLRVVATSC